MFYIILDNQILFEKKFFSKVLEELFIFLDEFFCLFFINFVVKPFDGLINYTFTLEIYLCLGVTVFALIYVEKNIGPHVIDKASFSFGDCFEDDFKQIADVSIKVILDFSLCSK